jgi:SET domain
LQHRQEKKNNCHNLLFFVVMASEWRRSMLATLPVVGNGNEIKKSNVPNAGLGLFVTRDFDMGACVGYWHPTELIPYNDARRHPPEIRTHYRSLFAMRWVIDGKVKDDKDPRIVLNRLGGAGYTNDLQSQNLNNCEFDWIDWPERTDIFDFTDLDVRIIILRATRPIKAGEELFVSYGADYWSTYK